ncbi:uncharacterized protein LOC124828976 isoform X3 [Vigna umbellata]|uniref:uncharacterized protein LOC124828976 isoform X3 n=1 Tax=Vigna umbellata TaxID=87088 RepID=UPI001F5E3B9F|nr:uncharacterized protein LOC124828976 isoform X3 [Vigna umbellata]
MGFNSVYRSLQELFPQVDARLLRAVAIEHPKDADLAAGIVLAEVIPVMSKKLPLATPPQDNAHWAPLNVEAESEEEGSSLRHRQLVQDIDVGPSSAPHSIYTKPADYSLVPDLNEALDNSTLSNVSNSNGVTEKFLGMDDMKELDVLQKVKDNFIEEISNKIAMEISNCFIQEGHIPEDCETNLIEVESSEVQAVCLAQGNTLNSKDSLQSEFNAGFSSAVDKTSDVEDDIGGKNEVSQYSQVCRIDLLEEIIDDAKSNKKTLFSSMESLINLMRDVQLQEQAAQQASMDAATGGSNILARVEGYKTVLEQAKEANDMHAGEVYGEKAILATELKELQSRLLSLSDERDKCLAILNEMRRVLEARLAAAEEFRKAAENEKLEKAESAQRALAEQEKLVEKVLHESERLKQEAEENSKLREFLMDRGQVVDVLQGEISVICQDIRLLKERFDANLPLSESFTSSQTSCKLASSGTSHKTAASDVGSVHGDSSERSKTSESLSSKSGHDEEKSKAYQNALLDDGWDIFEKDAELNSGVY